jgi:hypothetical protein
MNRISLKVIKKTALMNKYTNLEQVKSSVSNHFLQELHELNLNIILTTFFELGIPYA